MYSHNVMTSFSDKLPGCSLVFHRRPPATTLNFPQGLPSTEQRRLDPQKGTPHWRFGTQKSIQQSITGGERRQS